MTRDMRALRTTGWIGLVAGPVLGLIVYAIAPNEEIATGVADARTVVEFGHAGRATLGLMVWMAVWWLTEATHVSATALLPIAVLPLVTVGEFSSASAAATAATQPYANRFIALFMGGFILALAMERWGLHRRIALVTLRLIGGGPTRIVAGFMAITAVMSMWVSNTATTVMMLPIALSVTTLISASSSEDAVVGRRRPEHFGLCMMLGIAYAASVGGIATLIGTPPNLLLAGFIEDTYGVEISFVGWLGVGLPLVVVFVPVIWLLLTRAVYPFPTGPRAGRHDLFRAEYERLGPMKPGEWITMTVFLITAMGWIFRPVISGGWQGDPDPLTGDLVYIIPPLIPGLTDAGLAIIAALLLFLIPVSLRRGEFVMNWETAKRLPWGILILFGGGLSLAAAVSRHGVAAFIGQQAAVLETLPAVLVVLAIAAGVIFLTELTSNTATTATLLPILAGIAPALGLEPLLLLVPATIAASCAFMMPIATPPNAIVFGSGHVTIPQMCHAGIWLNIIAIPLVTLLTYAIAVPLLRL